MARIHREKGVQLLAGEQVGAFVGSGRLEAAETASGRRLECELAIIGLGDHHNVELLEGSGVAIDNGVLVDERCRTNVPDIYAAGDVANHLHPGLGRVRVEHYNNAEKQGQAAACFMLGSSEVYDYLHSFWSDQYEHKIEYLGIATHWDRFVLRGNLESGKFLGFYLKDGVVLAAMGLDRGGDPEIDEKGELAACGPLIRSQARVDPGLLADEGIDLHQLGAVSPRVSG
jgi:3-phenylpropionate/trans-cinnamate dioxygenase ferredoxin reductase subunit